MSLIATQGEDDIVAKVKTVPGIDVMQGSYTSDGYTPTYDINKMFKPYVLVEFHGGFPVADNGIIGPDKDSLRSTFSVLVVSPDDRTSRVLRDQIKVALLTNFQPTDGSSLKVTNGYNTVDGNLGFQRYLHVTGYSYVTNLS